MAKPKKPSVDPDQRQTLLLDVCLRRAYRVDLQEEIPVRLQKLLDELQRRLPDAQEPDRDE